MSEILFRVARALCEERTWPGAWERANEAEKSAWLRDATAAISAMCSVSRELGELQGKASIMEHVHVLDDWREKCEGLEADVAKLREALTPSAETKAAYWGEFYFMHPVMNENGDEDWEKLQIPWTSIKEIMNAISARAALEGTK